MRLAFPSLLLAIILSLPAFAQTAQVGGDRGARGNAKAAVEYVHYRPAAWNSEQVTEYENEFPNEGGLIYVYFRNLQEDAPLDLRFWRVNGQDESYWVLNHFVAWHRLYRNNIPPGELGVLEINATSKDFATGEPFRFSWVDRTWLPALNFDGKLEADPVQVSFIRVLPGMKAIEVHVRYTGAKRILFEDIQVNGHTVESVEWRAESLQNPGHTIARLQLARPLNPSELLVVQLAIREGVSRRVVYAHRRAFEDIFPIGLWNSDAKNWEHFHRLHLDTMVGPHNADHPFYTEAAKKYGFRSMVHTGMPVNVDILRELGDEPSVVAWMTRDEPDWSIPPNIMLYADDEVRKRNNTKPTFLTLCRNIKFFEYAPIADIPCQDHYAVTAPSSSKWPTPYGTRLEETAYYTEDLKKASEPKPIWIWTQGIADWGERPKRPVPTAEEAAAQLILNLGRGAKGILWFNWHDERVKEYPDLMAAIGGWSRVMKIMRDDFLASEPATLLPVEAPARVDVAPLVTWDKLVLCITNTDYDIHPEAYPFRAKEDVRITVSLPSWVRPGAALQVSPAGIETREFTVDDGRVTVTLPRLHDVAVLVIAQEGVQATYEAANAAALTVEQ
jgi:hypothetical protein